MAAAFSSTSASNTATAGGPNNSTTPIFTIVFTVVTLAYASYRLAHSYGKNLEMARAERRAAWQAEGPLL